MLHHAIPCVANVATIALIAERRGGRRGGGRIRVEHAVVVAVCGCISVEWWVGVVTTRIVELTKTITPPR